MTWRVGRKLGRTLYRRIDDGLEAYEEFLGMMETSELAQLVCDAVNGVAQQVTLGKTLVRKEPPPAGPTVQRSVDPYDAGCTVVSVNRDDRIYVVPQDDRAVPAVPADADLTVVELDPLGDDADTRDT